MKKLYFTLAAFLFLVFANAQIVNIPDPVFKAMLLGASSSNEIASTQFSSLDGSAGSYNSIDTNGDGEIQVSEASVIKYLDLTFSFYMNNLEGISSFTNLQFLDCSFHYLQSINLSALTSLKYLICYENQFTSLDVSGLINLEVLSCFENQLTVLDVSSLINLKKLDCHSTQIQSINVSGLSNLKQLNCNYNLLQSIDLSSLTNLQSLECSYNQIPSLNINGLTNLQTINCSYNQIPSLNLSGLTNLQTINCSNNLLPSLNLNGLTNLQTLNCTNNQLPSLNVSGLTNLQTLSCSNNQLPSLNVSGLTNLQYLDCSNNLLPSLNLNGLINLQSLVYSYNQIPSLNISGLINLQLLGCSNNQISSLNLSSLTNLRSLVCGDNQLSSLDLNGLTNLKRLSCENNQLTSLNVKELNFLEFLNCNNNQLISLFMTNYNYLFSTGEIEFANNPNLVYICVNDLHNNSIQWQVDFYGYTNCNVNSYCSFTPGGTFYTIQGNSKVDGDSNGCDASDSIFPNLKFNTTDGTISGSMISNSSGNYAFPIQEGTYTITPQLENPTYFTVSPTSATVTFPTATSPYDQNFCVAPNGVHHDLDVVIIPIGIAQPGFDVIYKILYKNKGNLNENASVNFNYNDANLDFVSSSVAPTTQTSGTLSWSVGTLSPFQRGEMLVTLNLNSPTETPAVNQGDILSYTATANGLTTDETPDDNTTTLNQEVVNSLDPNDKTCLEGATINPSMIGKYVHYEIRFENTGTFPATNIVVKDMIDTTKFDVASLQMIDASHSCVTKITNLDKVEFIFENINLPFDDANNDGYVVFKIKTKPTLVVGNTISNTANIYFDYNFPIVTNTATSTFSTLQNDTFDFDNYFTIYPNPVGEYLNITIKQATEMYSITIYNLIGQQVQTTTYPTETVDVSSLTTGNYIVKVVTDKGVSSSKFVKE